MKIFWLGIKKYKWRIIFVIFVFFVAYPFLVYSYFRRYVYINENLVAPTNVGIVFGAGITTDDQPRPALKDRLQKAANLYHKGKVKKLLVSGDNRQVEYDEPTAMYLKLIELGVKQEDIIRDFAGRRTYDTCYRAKHIFKVEKAVLITQGFHLPRAIYLCRSLGVEAMGVYSEGPFSSYHSPWYDFREILGIYNVFIDLYIRRPDVVTGEPLPIE